MSNLKIVRQRLKSLKSTRKITSAMKLVAASRYRKCQNLHGQQKIYTDTFFEELRKWVSPELGQPSKKAQGSLLIVHSPEKGLCGSYVSLLVQSVGLFMQSHKIDRVVCSSQKGPSLFPKLDISFLDKKEIEKNFSSWVEEYQTIYVTRGIFKNALSYRVECEKLWPIDINHKEQDIVESDTDFTALQGRWLVEALKARLSFSHNESLLVEEAARMNAMEQATRNADDLIDSLHRLYNRTRQDRITTELTEIISGTAALEN